MALLTTQELLDGPFLPSSSRPVHVHAGDLGDIINYIPAMLVAGGTLLLVNEDQGQRQFLGSSGMMFITSLLNVVYGPSAEKPRFMTVADFGDRFLPSVRKAFPNHPYVFDVGQFRSSYQHNNAGLTLMQSFLAQVTKNSAQAKDSVFHRECSWIDPDIPDRPRDLVVFGRSFRYRSLLKYGDVFYRLVLQVFRHTSCAFVGTPEEYSDFHKLVGPGAPKFYPTQSACEVRSVMSRAKLFVGNQSFPYALAEAMKVPAILERCLDADTTAFQRHRLFHLNDLGIWHSSTSFDRALPVSVESVRAAISKVVIEQ